MPSLTTWATFCPCGQCYPRDQNKHMAAPVKVARQQTTREFSGTFRTLPPTGRNLPNPTSGTYTNTRRNSPEPSGTFQDLPNQPTPAYAGPLQNLPEPSGTCLRNRTYTILHRNFSEPSGTRLRNLYQHTPELSGTFRNPPEPTPAHAGTLRNLPEPASGTYTSIHRNFSEPSGTRLRNLYQHTTELPGTFRDLPEPSSGTCSCDPHRHTPELIWAEDPISSRCWGKKHIKLVDVFFSPPPHRERKLAGRSGIWPT